MGKHRNQPAGRKAGDGKPGYKNISRTHQWTKGCASPNPEGARLRKPKSLWEEFSEHVSSIARAGIDVGDHSMPTLEVVVRQAFLWAARDPKAAAKFLPYLVDLIARVSPPEAVPETDLTEEDDRLIDQSLERLARSRGSDD